MSLAGCEGAEPLPCCQEADRATQCTATPGSRQLHSQGPRCRLLAALHPGTGQATPGSDHQHQRKPHRHGRLLHMHHTLYCVLPFPHPLPTPGEQALLTAPKHSVCRYLAPTTQTLPACFFCRALLLLRPPQMPPRPVAPPPRLSWDSSSCISSTPGACYCLHMEHEGGERT
jgi:hypothetical protein